MKYGYMRVSTQHSDSKVNNQTFDRQLLILKENEILEENIIEERISGGVSTSKRPQWDMLLEKLVAGDEILVTEMSRLARSLQDLIATVNLLIKMKVGITFIKENIVVSETGLGSMTKLMFNMFGAFAEFEKDLISERTKQGLQAKKEQGIKLGRPATVTIEKTVLIKNAYESGMSITDMANIYNITRQCIYKYINKYEWEEQTNELKRIYKRNKVVNDNYHLKLLEEYESGLEG